MDGRDGSVKMHERTAAALKPTIPAFCISLLHALHHPQPPKRLQGHKSCGCHHQQCWSWPASDPTRPHAPVLSSDYHPHHLLTAFVAWGSSTQIKFSLRCLPFSIVFCRVGFHRKGCSRGKTGWDTGKNDKSPMMEIFWCAGDPKEGFRQDFGLCQCWSLEAFQGGHAAGVSLSPASLGFRGMETAWGMSCGSSGAACRQPETQGRVHAPKTCLLLPARSVGLIKDFICPYEVSLLPALDPAQLRLS